VRHDLTDEEIQSMLESVGQHLLKAPDLRKLSRLGIDEIALVKGQGNYLAVLVDLEQKKPIAILPSRRQEDLRACFESWGMALARHAALSEVLNQIKEVSIDLWKPYKKLVKDLMPSADIIADRFHVMKIINNELDSSRKSAKFKATAEKNASQKASVLAGLNNSKYSLLKNQKDLNEVQVEKLRQVMRNAAGSRGKGVGSRENPHK